MSSCTFEEGSRPPPQVRKLRLLGGLLAAALGMGVAHAAPVAATAGHGLIERSDGYLEGCNAIIYYEVIGRGRPLIVLHGGPGDTHEYFLPYFLPLARHHKLVFIDERGSGRSQRLSDVSQYTLANMACDVDAARRALGLGDTDVLGHSFGGILAQAYATSYPTHVRRLILAGTGSSAARVNEDFKTIMDSLPASLRDKIEAREAQGVIGPDGAQLQEYRKLADEAELPYNYVVRPPAWSEAGDPISWEVLTQMWGGRSDFHIDGNLKGFDLVPELRRLATPTLIIAGDHDLVSRATLEQTHSALRNSSVVVLEHSGHMMFVDQSEAFLRAVKGFLEE
jgi:proline iminopeptidase